MGSRGFLDSLSVKCRCGRRVYPQPFGCEVCLFCESGVYDEMVLNINALSRNATVFDTVPALRHKILSIMTINALAAFNRGVLQYILMTRGSPFHAFSYSTNGMAGNISQSEDILDRIVSFL